jgi:hypothetical protein
MSAIKTDRQTLFRLLGALIADHLWQGLADWGWSGLNLQSNKADIGKQLSVHVTTSTQMYNLGDLSPSKAR